MSVQGSYFDIISAKNPKVWFRFNETSGTPSNSGSLSASLTASGSPLLNENTDVDGRAVYFNRSSQYQLSNFPSFSAFNDRSFSIEFWFKTNTTITSQNGSFGIFEIMSTDDININTRQNIQFIIHGINSSYPQGHISLYQQAAGLTANTNLPYETGQSTPRYDDNKWHHVVITSTTSDLKLYMDGGLLKTIPVTTSGGWPSTFILDQNGPKYIGRNRASYFQGWLDEFAIYDYALTAPQVNENYVAGTAVYINDIPGTASALMLQPTQTTAAQLTAAPMTANADGSGHAASTVEFPTLLNTYMSGLTLQTWFKFDKSKTLTDYGTEPTRASAWGSLVTNNPTSGIQGSGELVLLDDANTVNLVSQNTPNATGIAALLNDENFTIGFWTKKLVKEDSIFISSYNTGNTENVFFKWNADGGITFSILVNNNTHSIASNTDITDGEWHFVVAKLSSNTMQLWIDNTSIGTTTMNHTFTLDRFQFEATSTDKVHLSQFFVTTAAAIGTTEIANIWDYGVPTSVQATAYMPEPIIRFNSAFNDYIESKNPVIDYRLDEPTGNPSNYGSASISLIPYLNPQGFTQNEVGLNNRAFKFTSREQTTRGNYSFDAGTFSTDDLCTIGVVFKIGNATNQQGIVGFGGREQTGVGDGNGFSLQMLATSGYLRVLAGNANGTVTNYTGTTNYADSKWHLAVIVKSASTVKLYVDGKEHLSSSNSTQMTDNGEFIIGGVAGIIASNLSVDKLIDEVFVTNTAFTAQEVFEAWRSLRLEMDTTATAEAIQPTTILGTGNIYVASPLTSSSEFVMPSISGEIAIQSDHLEASATFIMPNYGTTVVIDSNYGQTSATANAEFHMPAWSIGDGHVAVHLEASAQMVHPLSISGGTISVPPGVAGPALLVDPGIITIKGARVFADPAIAGAFLPLPPSYLTLNDDDWFVRLLEGHADRAREAVQTVGTGTNLPNQATTDVIKGGFLSFFEDILLDITPSTTIKTISSEIPAFYFESQETVRYDNNGNIIPPNTAKNSAVASAVRGSNNPQPRLGAGYFDNQERKAVRVENIEFTLPGTTSQNSERPYNLEFSIRTTKQNQVLAYGIKTSNLYFSRKVGAIGLFDGKIYLTEDGSVKFGLTGPGIRGLYPTTAPHPKQFVNRAQYLLGKTNIADGKWHHIIIQRGWREGRTQIWVDGKLDRQFGVQTENLGSPSVTGFPGLDGTNTVRPYILGFNSSDPLLYSDFETSAWNYYPGRFLTSQQVGLNYIAYQKSKPIKVAPMLGTITIGKDNIGRGNRGRMLLLYWWQNPPGLNQFVVTKNNPITTGYDGNNSPFTPNDLYDFPKVGPKDWYDWDVFPVNVTGKTGMSDLFTETVARTNAGYVDIETGSYRMLDLQKDLDLSQFDMIMFANYPTTSAQLDRFIRDEYIDDYFGVTEKDIYQDFLKSLRKAVDSGISLYIQFDQLARDLNIYDRVERIPVFEEYDPTVFDGSDPRAIEKTSIQWDLANNKVIVASAYQLDKRVGAYWRDLSDNMRHRVINTVEFLTDDPSFIWIDRAFYQNSDVLDFGGPNRSYNKYEYRIDGLQVGDEFIFGNGSDVTAFGNSRARQTSILAVPFENVKAGRVITAQPEKYYKGANLVDNPYKNYAHSIALLPGDILDNKPVGGKIFVSISETFWDYTTEERYVDLYSDYWIDMIYNLGFWGLKLSEGGNGSAEAKRDSYKSTSHYVNPQGLTQEHYNHLTYWSQNAKFARMQLAGGDPTGIQLGLFFGIGDDNTKQYVSKNRQALSGFERRRDAQGRFASGVAGGNGQLFFQITTGRVTDTVNVYVPNLLTRGFMWLSDRIRTSGLVIRTEAMTAEARFQPSTAVVDKDVVKNAQSMISNAILPTNITGTIERIVFSTVYSTLPLTATAMMPTLGKQIFADEATCIARFPDPGVFAYSVEEVILKIENYQPVLYVRGDKIR